MPLFKDITEIGKMFYVKILHSIAIIYSATEQFSQDLRGNPIYLSKTSTKGQRSRVGKTKNPPARPQLL